MNFLKAVFTLLAFFVLSVASTQNISLDQRLELNQVDTNYKSVSLGYDKDGFIVIQRYKVGDLAFGGIVFYVDSTGLHGLVAHASDIANGITWNNDGVVRTRVESGGLGAGASNTAVLSALLIPEDRDGTFAALVCLGLESGGYGDWYLPSRYELELLYHNLYLNNLGDFPLPLWEYWSSTEVDAAKAYSLEFQDGQTNETDKLSFLAVRPIRSF